MHLVRPRFQPFEEPVDTVPLRFPLPRPGGVAPKHPVPRGFRQLVPWRVEIHAGFAGGLLAGVLLHVLLAFGEALGLPGFDRAFAQRLAAIRNDERVIDADHPAETAAGLAGADRGIEGKACRRRVLVRDVAMCAVEARRIACPGRVVGILLRRGAVGDPRVDASAAEPLRGFRGLPQAVAVEGVPAQAVADHRKRLRVAVRAAAMHARVALRRKVFADLVFGEVGGHADGKGEHEAPRLRHAGFPRRGTAGPRDQVRGDRCRGVAPDRAAAAAAMQMARARIEQLQVIVELRHRADGAARAADRIGLVDCDRRRHPFDAVDRRSIHAIEKLARIRREGLDVAPLPFGVERVEDEGALPRAGDARHHDQVPGGKIEVEVAQIVLTRAADADPALSLRRRIHAARNASASRTQYAAPIGSRSSLKS